MKKRILSILAALVVVGFLLYHYGPEIVRSMNTAYAVGDLTVDWGIGVGDVGPVFNVSNMAPGESQSHEVTITNGSAQTRPVGIKGTVNTETGDLGNAMDVVILRDGNPVYGSDSPTGPKTMQQFFADSTQSNFVALGNLAPSTSSTYTIAVTFRTDAGNEFQNKTLTFSLIMGMAFDVPTACSTMNLNGKTVFGTAGNDRLRGTTKNDLIFSLEGSDTVDGGNGNDCIVNVSGTGRLDGGNGNDVIISGSGADRIEGGNGNDRIKAGAGADTVTGGNGKDSLHGEGDADRLDGGNGNDTMLGGTGNDQLIGGLGNDQLQGEDGTDSANGNLGKDTCIAESTKACEL